MVQWFWIRGSIFFEWNDVIFWSTLAALVIVNSVYEARHGRARGLAQRARSLGESIGLVLRTAGTFAVICTLWSLWTSESLSDWLLMLRAAGRLPPWGPGRIALSVGVAALCAMATVYAVWKAGRGGTKSVGPRYSPAAVLATSMVLCVLTMPAVGARLGDSGNILGSLRLASLNRRDAEAFQRGYYENLVDVRKFYDDELWRIYENMPADFVRSLSRAGLSQPTGDPQEYELIPLAEGRFVGAMVRTNRWGMRDKDYSQNRPAGTYRMALLGPSTAMGSGVEQHESFEFLLEQRLNERRDDGLSGPYEVLNFGVAGYTPFHVLFQLRKKVFSFEPNAVLYLGHSGDLEGAARQWTGMLAQGAEFSDSRLRALADQTGIDSKTGPTESRRRMKPYRSELLAWVYETIVTDCRRRDVVPVFVYMQTVMELTEPWRSVDREEVMRLARQAGFVILDLTGAYDGHRPSSLWIRENDNHPNALGSRLIADRLYLRLREDGRQIGLLR
jgi:hypothetical protein